MGKIFLLFWLMSVSAFSEDLLRMGSDIYNQSEMNSCLYCHGLGGTDGKIKNAADLSKPKSWKIYKVLGGDKAYKEGRDLFYKRFQEATENLLIQGALLHHIHFARANDWFDLSSSSVKPYDSQMIGLSGVASLSWLKKNKVKKEKAAKALYFYLQSLDQEKFFLAP